MIPFRVRAPTPRTAGSGAAAAVIAVASAGLWTTPAAQELDVAYVVTPPEVVDAMVSLAGVGGGDYVIDLGTGDGRLAIAAVQQGAVGLGVDLDPVRVREARKNAAEAGVAQRVVFLEQDLFDTELSRASVVMMYLNSAVNLRLRDRLLGELRPGSRVLSHNFDMGEWRPDEHRQLLRNDEGNFYIHDVYRWVVPAELDGRWQGRAGEARLGMSIEQQFQELRIELQIDGTLLEIDKARLDGNRVTVIGRHPQERTAYLFNGRVEGSNIDGVVQMQSVDTESVADWRASRR